MKYLSVLGSTGSIGQNVLDIVSRFPDRYAIKALAAATQVETLARQVERFRPEVAVVIDEAHARQLAARLPSDLAVDIVFGDQGYADAAAHPDVHMTVSAIVGAAGLLPTVAAIRAGKDIALANKETLVAAGDVVMALAREKGVRILPVDSEHSAVFQCIEGQAKTALAKILLTASGGPFRTTPAAVFETIRPEDALAHPTWSMGRKISIDSATLMNKGLEVIEARHLFDLDASRIEVVVHPQSIVHSMAVFHDGAVLAQMGAPDMRGAIAYALSWPERLPLDLPVPDFAALGALVFEAPDTQRFPCLSLAYEACRVGHTLPAVLNAANETAVHAFLDRQIPFTAIARIIEQVMDKHVLEKKPDLSDIIGTDAWARDQAEIFIRQQRGR
ncbi:1-deoxy-D-xylulose-5-phosphate reductoisomerase [Desulfatiferula olefinivorans]